MYIVDGFEVGSNIVPFSHFDSLMILYFFFPQKVESFLSVNNILAFLEAILKLKIIRNKCWTF